jgi:uncharacterized membrane protein YdjX (TVP38/TMEM64 family)
MPVLVSSTLAVYAIRYETQIGQLPLEYWLLFYAITCFTMAFALTPTTFIALISGYFLGWISLPFMSVSYLIASWLGYRAAVFFDRGKLLQSLEERKGVRQFIERLKTGQLGIIIMSRLSPVLPFAMMNVLLALLRVNLTKFVWGGFIGMLPRTVVSIWAGTQTREIRTLLEEGDRGYTMELTYLVLILISVAGFAYYFKRATGTPPEK